MSIPVQVHPFSSVLIASALSNEVIKGYALEEQLKKSLSEASKPGQSLTLFCGHTSVLFPVENLIFCEAAELLDILGARLPPNTWIFIAGRQGVFDAIHVLSDTHIRFIQVTAGTSHIFYLDIIDTLLRKLDQSDIRWTHLEYMVLRPISDLKKHFRLNTARGRLQGYVRFDEQPWHREDLRENAQYALLAWSYN
jgi:hypothetical protein